MPAAAYQYEPASAGEPEPEPAYSPPQERVVEYEQPPEETPSETIPDSLDEWVSEPEPQPQVDHLEALDSATTTDHADASVKSVNATLEKVSKDKAASKGKDDIDEILDLLGD